MEELPCVVNSVHCFCFPLCHLLCSSFIMIPMAHDLWDIYMVWKWRKGVNALTRGLSPVGRTKLLRWRLPDFPTGRSETLDDMDESLSWWRSGKYPFICVILLILCLFISLLDKRYGDTTTKIRENRNADTVSKGIKDFPK